MVNHIGSYQLTLLFEVNTLRKHVEVDYFRKLDADVAGKFQIIRVHRN